MLRVAVNDLQQVLNGGTIEFLGQNVPLLGLRNSRTIVAGHDRVAAARLAAARRRCGQVVSFANLAIDGLGFASPVLGSIGTPLTVHETELAGATTPTDAYAAAIAVIVSLMFVTLLLAAGMLALERSENAYPRLVRGPGHRRRRCCRRRSCWPPPARPSVTLAMAAFVSLFVHLDWARFELWVVALALGGAGLRRARRGDRRRRARGQRGVADGVPAVAADRVRRARAGDAVSGTLQVGPRRDLVRVPVQGGAAGGLNAFSGAAPGIGWPLVHLAVLTVVFGRWRGWRCAASPDVRSSA